jgi:hypothetical protein
MKQLPLDELTFPEIIEGDYLYADKTRYIHNLLHGGRKQIFLSRPRRFGKSLLLKTIETLFTDNGDSFKNLWIGSSKYEFSRCPVIFLDLSVMDSRSPEKLYDDLLSVLIGMAEEDNLEISQKSLNLFFVSLIRELSKKYKSKVVVLVDEYDAPVADNISNFELVRENADVLRNFFKVLKTRDVISSLRFAFITGVTRFGLTTMGSGANHLYDISMKPEYAGICGFTVEEFETLFADRMEHTLSRLKEKGILRPSASARDLKERIYHWYDGYDWSGETKTRVLNPYSILNFFYDCSFNNYWIETGHPSHLTALMEKNPVACLESTLKSHTGPELRKSDFDSFEPAPVLFHTGYLTIDKIIIDPDPSSSVDANKEITRYALKLPNYEVSSSFNKDFFSVIFGDKISRIQLKTKATKLKEAIFKENSDFVSTTFMELFGAISHHQWPEDEKTFQALVRVTLSAMGFDVLTELPGRKGRLDPCADLSNGYLIIELRYRPGSFKKLTKSHEYEILNKMVSKHVEEDKYLKCLAEVTRKHAEISPFREMIAENGRSDGLNPEEITPLVSNVILSALSDTERYETLAVLVRGVMTKQQFNEEFNAEFKKITTEGLTDERIDKILTAAANEALCDMVEKDHSSVFKAKGKKIYKLGMAMYGNGTKIKARFGKPGN